MPYLRRAAESAGFDLIPDTELPIENVPDDTVLEPSQLAHSQMNTDLVLPIEPFQGISTKPPHSTRLSDAKSEKDRNDDADEDKEETSSAKLLLNRDVEISNYHGINWVQWFEHLHFDLIFSIIGLFFLFFILSYWSVFRLSQMILLNREITQ